MRTNHTSLSSTLPRCSFMVTNPNAPAQPSGVSEKSMTSPTTARACSSASSTEVAVVPSPPTCTGSSSSPQAARRAGSAPPTRASPIPCFAVQPRNCRRSSPSVAGVPDVPSTVSSRLSNGGGTRPRARPFPWPSDDGELAGHLLGVDVADVAVGAGLQIQLQGLSRRAGLDVGLGVDPRPRDVQVVGDPLVLVVEADGSAACTGPGAESGTGWRRPVWHRGGDRHEQMDQALAGRR